MGYLSSTSGMCRITLSYLDFSSVFHTSLVLLTPVPNTRDIPLLAFSLNIMSADSYIIFPQCDNWIVLNMEQGLVLLPVFSMDLWTDPVWPRVLRWIYLYLHLMVNFRKTRKRTLNSEFCYNTQV